MPGEGTWTINIAQKVVDMEATLASRAARATFRIAHQRAVTDSKAAEAAISAAEGRISVATAAEQFEKAAAELAVRRAGAAKDLAGKRKDLASEIELLGFERQMVLHKSRTQDLYDEAVERAEAAVIGLRQVYAIAVPAVPKATAASVEDLLEWCRSAARALLGLDSVVVKQTVVSSIREASPNWKKQIAKGVEIDLAWLASLGAVVRVRDVRVRAKGKRKTSVLVALTPPATAADRTAAGEARQVKQAVPTVSVATCEDEMDERGPSTARVLHNYCASGRWTIACPADLAEVDDVLLELTVSCLAM